MALIVIQHSVVDNFDVDPTFVVTSTNRFLAGSVVGLVASGNDSNGYLSKPSTVVGPLGLAGDSISDAYQTTAYSADLVISPTGAKRWTSNRVSDFYNETIASGEMTVYFGNGKFATDQYVLTDSFTPGAAIFTTAAGLVTASPGSGLLARQIGYCAAAPTAYPSGVPGVDSPSVDNSMSLGTYLTIFLSI